MTMRANAPFTAILALAALSLSPAALLAARPRPAVHPHPAKPHQAQPHTPHGTRTKAHVTSHLEPAARKRSRKHPREVPGKLSTAKPRHRSTRRKHQEPADDNLPATILRIHTPALRTPAAESAQQLNAADAAPVLSIIRPTTERPYLPPIEEAATTPLLLPSLYNKRGRLIVPPPLKGSHEILLRQNQLADRDGLNRIQDDNDIVELRRERLLVPLPATDMLLIDERLPTNRRYCRPWTAQFLAVLARTYYLRFRTPLQVNSAVRTVEFQQHLLRINGNAAPAEGDTASPHLTGQAVDLAKHGLTLTQIAWLRGYLLPLVQDGKVDVEEEFQQACFHISVYKRYMPPAQVPPHNLTASHTGPAAALATAIR